MHKYLLILFLSLSSTLSAKVNEEPIHNELRNLLKNVQKEVNNEQYDKLGQYFHNNLKITTINQEVISTKDGIVKYFNRWFGPDKKLKKIDMRLFADAKTEFYANNTIGVIQGRGEEDYVLTDSRTFDIKTRWTATVIKDSGGKWKILTLHIGTDFLDNPVLDMVEKSTRYYALVAGLTGLLLGLLVGFLIWRRKQ